MLLFALDRQFSLSFLRVCLVQILVQRNMRLTTKKMRSVTKATFILFNTNLCEDTLDSSAFLTPVQMEFDAHLCVDWRAR